ncbi:thioredoxin [Rhodococcus phage Peregrin]|jgi:hypothetical protein|nr:thioredoxin [Rhodococcus phage Peregrin]
MKTLIVYGQDLDNCVLCRQYEPVVQMLIEEGYEVERIDAFTPEGIANPRNLEYQVMGTPTTIILNDGEYETQFVGARPLSFMHKLLEN